MEKDNSIFFIALGIGFLLLLPAAESVGGNLVQIATFLVVGYWATMGLCFLIFILKNIMAQYSVSTLLYNIWLFVSLMCVSIGILAIIDDGIEEARWAMWLVFYGVSVGFMKRKEL